MGNSFCFSLTCLLTQRQMPLFNLNQFPRRGQQQLAGEDGEATFSLFLASLGSTQIVCAGWACSQGRQEARLIPILKFQVPAASVYEDEKSTGRLSAPRGKRHFCTKAGC